MSSPYQAISYLGPLCPPPPRLLETLSVQHLSFKLFFLMPNSSDLSTLSCDVNVYSTSPSGIPPSYFTKCYSESVIITREAQVPSLLLSRWVALRVALCLRLLHQDILHLLFLGGQSTWYLLLVLQRPNMPPPAHHSTTSVTDGWPCFWIL